MGEQGQCRRSIPAWAGETAIRMNKRNWNYGLSPRGRGKPCPAWPPITARRSIPAWAGETTQTNALTHLDEVYPRVGGGNDALAAHAHAGSGLSPRGRGKRAQLPEQGIAPGSIPAWAGETGKVGKKNDMNKVYPRVGGGNPIRPATSSCPQGLSPRGRGKLQRRVNHQPLQRSIPAWAGETRMGEKRNGAIGVYPRVGGGNRGNLEEPIRPAGLSPRGRGKPTFGG